MFIAGGAVFAATLAAGAPASAGPKVIRSPDDPARVQTTVVLGDLDLARPAGAEAAARRIRRAAKAVCGADTTLSYPLILQTQRLACAKASMQDAVSRLGHPLVTRAAYGEEAPAVYAAR